MLSDLAPWPYTDKKGNEKFGSADPAAFEDEWTNAWNDVVGLDKAGTDSQIARVANRLLKYYTDNLGYNLDDLATVLRRSLKGGTGSEVALMYMKEAYYEVLNILAAYRNQVKLDDLGDMLSDLSPYTFKSDDCVSADPAEYADWKEAWARIVGTDRGATPLQIFTAACMLLDYYENELGYNLGESRRVFKKGSASNLIN
jgi:hypothetical protein